jgi:2-oxoglutarate dehydrogenase E1 component
VRIEQVAPFPYREVSKQLDLYPNAEICWAQEEHRNQGAYLYAKERIDLLMESSSHSGKPVRYIGRKISGSTAVGSNNTHKQQLEELLQDAFSN